MLHLLSSQSELRPIFTAETKLLLSCVRGTAGIEEGKTRREEGEEEERKEGRKNGRKEGRTKRSNEERKEGRNE